MNDYSDEEQVEALKRWWKSYGAYIVVGVVLALVVSFAWRYWEQHKTKVAVNSSMMYQYTLFSLEQAKDAEFEAQAQALMAHYPHTPYAQMIALKLAKRAVEAKKFVKAKEYLVWVIDHSKMKPLTQVARIRAARVLLAMKDPKAALEMLQPVDDKMYLPLINDVRGDAYLAMKDRAKARKAYRAALNALPEASGIRMKLSAL